MAADTAPRSRRRLRVLIVDDNIDQVRTLAYLLRDDGHHVDYAINGIVALDLAKRTKPEVVVLDMRLPDTSGLLLARHMRRVEDLKRTPIIAVTAYPLDIEQAKAAGIDHVLAKPVPTGKLQALLEAVQPASSR